MYAEGGGGDVGSMMLEAIKEDDEEEATTSFSPPEDVAYLNDLEVCGFLLVIAVCCMLYAVATTSSAPLALHH